MVNEKQLKTQTVSEFIQKLENIDEINPKTVENWISNRTWIKISCIQEDTRDIGENIAHFKNICQ